MLGYCSMPPMDEGRGIGPKQGYDLIDYNRSALTAVR